MRTRFLIFFGIIFLIGINVSSCQNTDNSTGNNAVLSVADFESKLNSTSDVQLVDVRTSGEFTERHLKNAKNIDWNGNNFEEEINKLNKSKPTLVYCLSGGRSARAASKLRDMGFKEVYDMKGGINAWSNANKPLATLENPEKSKGLSVEEYTKQIKSDKLVLIDFYAPWCVPCIKMAPMLEELSIEQKDKFQLVRINADENSEIVKLMKVENLPSFFLYKNEKIIWTHLGSIEKDELLKVLMEN